MKKTIATLAIIAALALTGCGSGVDDSNTEDPSDLKVSVIKTPDGRSVTCVKFNRNGYVGGVSCDWDGAK
jgi:hypothetical protein